MLVQLLALNTDPEGLSATLHSVTDRQTDGRTDDMMMPIDVAVRSAKIMTFE